MCFTYNNKAKLRQHVESNMFTHSLAHSIFVLLLALSASISSLLSLPHPLPPASHPHPHPLPPSLSAQTCLSALNPKP